MKETVTTDTPDPGQPVGHDAGTATRRNLAPEHPNSLTEVNDRTGIDDLSAATTEHLRRLWMAGARDITVTYDADVVRHRSYLSHPHTDI